MCKYWIRLSPFCIDWQRTMFVYWKLVVKISFSKTVYFLFHHSNLIHWSKNLDRPWQMHRPSYRSVVRLNKISESELFWKNSNFLFFFLDESLWLAGFRTGGQCGRRTQNTATWKKWLEIFYDNFLCWWLGKPAEPPTRIGISLAQYSPYLILV